MASTNEPGFVSSELICQLLHMISNLEERIIFEVRRKTIDVHRIFEKDGVIFRLVERSRGRPHEVYLSLNEVVWMCECLVSFSSLLGVGWKKRQTRWREVMVAKEQSVSGHFIRIYVKGTGRSGMICIPELDSKAGWILISKKVCEGLLAVL